jgi:hypothetical protein
MSIAELHGKTPFIYSEDLLTADVFTAFRYLPPATGIVAFLLSIPGLGQKLSPITEDVHVTYHFWPLGERYRREPDLLLALQTGSRRIHVLIEAKYLSGASDLEIREIEEDGRLQKVGNQLGDQLRDLHNGQYRVFQEAQRSQQLTLASRPDDRYLLYLTAHLLCPQMELGRAAAAYPAAAGKLYWANWYQVYAHFEKMGLLLTAPPQSLILQDVCLLLARKGFASFQGFRPLPAARVSPAAASFWTDSYLHEPVFSGITGPPSFPVQPASSNFWRN